MAKLRGSLSTNLEAYASALELLLSFNGIGNIKSGIKTIVSEMRKHANDSPEHVRLKKKIAAASIDPRDVRERFNDIANGRD